MDKKIKRLLKKYIKENEFVEYDEFEQLVLDYMNIDFIKLSLFYMIVKNIYKNIDNDKIILEKASNIYKLGDIK